MCASFFSVKPSDVTATQNDNICLLTANSAYSIWLFLVLFSTGDSLHRYSSWSVAAVVLLLTSLLTLDLTGVRNPTSSWAASACIALGVTGGFFPRQVYYNQLSILSRNDEDIEDILHRTLTVAFAKFRFVCVNCVFSTSSSSVDVHFLEMYFYWDNKCTLHLLLLQSMSKIVFSITLIYIYFRTI